MGKFSKEDASKETGDSTSKVAQAEHDARNDAAAAGELPERQENKLSDSEHGQELHETFEKAGMIPKK